MSLSTMTHAIGQPLRIMQGPVKGSLLKSVPIPKVAELLEGGEVKKYVWIQAYKYGPNTMVSYGRVGIVLGTTEHGIIFQRTADSKPIFIGYKSTLSKSYQLFRLEGTFAGLTEDEIGDMQMAAIRTPQHALLEACDVEVPVVRVEDIPAADVWSPVSNPARKGVSEESKESEESESESSDDESPPKFQQVRKRWASPPGSPPASPPAAKRQKVQTVVVLDNESD